MGSSGGGPGSADSTYHTICRKARHTAMTDNDSTLQPIATRLNSFSRWSISAFVSASIGTSMIFTSPLAPRTIFTSGIASSRAICSSNIFARTVFGAVKRYLGGRSSLVCSLPPCRICISTGASRSKRRCTSRSCCSRDASSSGVSFTRISAAATSPPPPPPPLPPAAPSPSAFRSPPSLPSSLPGCCLSGLPGLPGEAEEEEEEEEGLLLLLHQRACARLKARCDAAAAAPLLLLLREREKRRIGAEEAAERRCTPAAWQRRCGADRAQSRARIGGVGGWVGGKWERWCGCAKNENSRVSDDGDALPMKYRYCSFY
eukprot:Rhum_TRINITY_DN13051_c0_g1::Rhum_TRINITY_DN13051_c0_g1_i1::g.56562::m.56562